MEGGVEEICTVNGKGIFWNTCVNEVLKASLKIW